MSVTYKSPLKLYTAMQTYGGYLITRTSKKVKNRQVAIYDTELGTIILANHITKFSKSQLNELNNLIQNLP